jgi:DNA (cytosine-5)-methyltransferase 1
VNVVSLCSGVGLIDLGLEWAGLNTIQLCELDGYATRILEQRYPGVPIHDDVWTIQPAACDIIAAGFPCQPFSVAGRRLGDQDPRHLWPAIIRAIRLARPRYVLLENVSGLVAWGLGEVLGDLAAAGFDAEWTCFNASDVGAPHRRRRWWCVATSDADRVRVWDESGGFFREGWGSQALVGAHGTPRPVADTDSVGRERWSGEQWQGRRHEPADGSRGDVPHADSSTIQPRRIGWGARETSRPGWWSAEPDVGRVAHGVTSRMDRLRCLGNGVVPQCAELIGLRLRQLDEVTP